MFRLLLAALLVGAFAALASAEDVSKVPLDELDARCEAAREEKIAPLREEKIEVCKADRGTDPAYCERFYSTYGDGGKSPTGAYVPPMFNDLPECKVAEEERQRRGPRQAN